MTSTVGLEPALAQAANRILALGYAEVRRRSADRAKLDALIEATVVACDILAPEPTGNQFFISDVSLAADGHVLGSSLATFDDDIRTQLGGRTPIPLDNGCNLYIPESAEALHFPLKEFWDELSLSCYRYEDEASRAPVNVTDAVWDDFKHSLRVAFDAVAREAEEATYTLLVDRRLERMKVTHTFSANYALGYLLPTSTSLRLRDRPDPQKRFSTDDIQALESLWTPTNNGCLRSQSHTNVESHTAGVVRGQHARSRWLLNHGFLPEMDPRQTLEQKAWDTSPCTWFMMPLTNHDVAPTAPVRVIAHAFRAVAPDFFEPHSWKVGVSPVDMFALRHRLAIVFSEALYEEICRMLAEAIAEGAIRGGVASIGDRCNQIASTIGLSTVVRVHRPDAPETSLRHRLEDLIARHALPFTERDLGSVEKALLSNISVIWSEPEWELDVLPHVVSRVNVLASRGDSGRGVVLAKALGELDTLMSEMHKRHRRIADDIGANYVSFSQLKALAPVFSAPPQRPCDDHERKESIEAWEFHCGHEFHVTDDEISASQKPCITSDTHGRHYCKVSRDELDRRLGYVLGAQALPGGRVEWSHEAKNRRDVFARLAENATYPEETLWEVIKRGTVYSEWEKPTVAAVVVLMCGAGAKVTMAEFEKFYLKTIPLDWNWTLTLCGLLEVAKWQRPSGYSGPDGQNAAIHISYSADKAKKQLEFRLAGTLMHYSAWVPKAVDALTAGIVGSSRDTNIAMAFGSSREKRAVAPNGRSPQWTHSVSAKATIECELLTDDVLVWRWIVMA